MATAIVTKPSKWLFSSKSFNKLIINFKPKSSSPPPPKNRTKEEDLLKVFRHFDTDEDGKISSEELGLYFSSTGDSSMSSADVQRVIEDFDSDGDNLLEFRDFVKLVEAGGNENGSGDDDLRRAFEMFEVDKGAGCITPRGVQKMLGKLGEAKSLEECVDMVRAFDLDGNGVLDFHEFRKMMT